MSVDVPAPSNGARRPLRPTPRPRPRPDDQTDHQTDHRTPTATPAVTTPPVDGPVGPGEAGAPAAPSTAPDAAAPEAAAPDASPDVATAAAATETADAVPPEAPQDGGGARDTSEDTTVIPVQRPQPTARPPRASTASGPLPRAVASPYPWMTSPSTTPWTGPRAPASTGSPAPSPLPAPDHGSPADTPPTADDVREPVAPRSPVSTRRHRTVVLAALVAVLVLFGAAGGTVGALLWPATFAARAEVLYPITKEQPTGFLRDDRNLTTQVVLLTSQTVLGPVAQRLNMPLERVQRSVSVELVGGSEVLQIEGRDRSPLVALAVVSAVLDRYLAVAATTTPSAAKAYLQGQLDGVRGELAAREQAPRATANDPDIQALRAREQQILGQLDEDTVVDVSGPQAQVLAPPYPVDKAVSPRVDLAAAAGALAGALAAAAAVGWVLRRRSPS